MKLHDLKPRPGAHRRPKRVGRGIAAGQGKTAGRGTKGEGARAGTGGKLYRQGGNLPFYRRLPLKRGSQAEVTPATLLEAGLLRDAGSPVVLLGQGEVKVALKVRVHRVSRGARAKIEAAGGTVEVLQA
uniref:Large ribosomal subunit protein uL15 n=1 Tax=uncultured Chloroflexi bacterium Rifle_16ft_4_minimus_26684 TaxID=1665063 RepID=A0A0H4TEV3_9CHLR|nr:50S ribosomal protein L15, large subunit ribosomal protein L15 [uncultured Chloroflexi bacterium Rifle_16ft_4_minimus_26684]